jgi:hypothetical protein
LIVSTMSSYSSLRKPCVVLSQTCATSAALSPSFPLRSMDLVPSFSLFLIFSPRQALPPHPAIFHMLSSRMRLVHSAAACTFAGEAQRDTQEHENTRAQEHKNTRAQHRWDNMATDAKESSRFEVPGAAPASCKGVS